MKLLLLSQQASLSSVEPGCERFDIYQSEEEPELFLLIVVWASEAHLVNTGKRKLLRNCTSRRYCYWCTVSPTCAAGSGQAPFELDSLNEKKRVSQLMSSPWGSASACRIAVGLLS